MSHLLEAKNIVTTFPFDGKTRNTAVNGVSLYLDRGEIIGLVGESGSGKSVTSMSMLQLILNPGQVSGEVYVEGMEGNMLSYGMDSEEARKVRGGKVGMIFQEPMTSLNPVLPVGFQISENITTHLGLKDKAAREKTIEIMRQVGIANPEVRYNQYPTEFSGGMRQRIMIAMVLAADPEVLIADEATTALDVTTQAQILELIQKLARERNMAVIIVTHNLGLVARYTDRIYVMYGGNIVESADKYTLFGKPIHPYTRGLLSAVPRLDDPKDRMLIPIDGLPPTPGPAQNTCRFYDRCPYREERCKEAECRLEEREGGHLVRCCLSTEELEQKRSEIEEKSPTRPEHDISAEVCLEVKNLKMYFPLYRGIMKKKVGEVRAVEDVSFQVRVGETLGVVGESGCGKSTLAKCIMQALKPNEGNIYYKGTDINTLKGADLKKIHSKITMIFQDPFSSLDPRQTAGSIVGEPLKINKLVKDRAEYGTKYCHNSPTLDEEPLQRAILAAINRAMSRKESLIQIVTGAMQQELAPIPGQTMSLADISRRLEQIDAETKDILVRSAKEQSYDAYTGKLKSLMNEAAMLKEKRGFMEQQRKENSEMARRIDSASAAMERITAALTQWDEMLIRQIVDTVRVASAEEIVVTLKNGEEIGQSLM